jgi:hypothetical protein
MRNPPRPNDETHLRRREAVAERIAPGSLGDPQAPLLPPVASYPVSTPPQEQNARRVPFSFRSRLGRWTLTQGVLTSPPPQQDRPCLEPFAIPASWEHPRGLVPSGVLDQMQQQGLGHQATPRQFSGEASVNIANIGERRVEADVHPHPIVFQGLRSLVTVVTVASFLWGEVLPVCLVRERSTTPSTTPLPQEGTVTTFTLAVNLCRAWT